MPEPMLTQDQIIHLFSQLSALNERIQELTNKVREQEKSIEELVALANKGKGSVWILMSVGGFFGAILSNIKTFISLIIP